MCQRAARGCPLLPSSRVGLYQAHRHRADAATTTTHPSHPEYSPLQATASPSRMNVTPAKWMLNREVRANNGAAVVHSVLVVPGCQSSPLVARSRIERWPNAFPRAIDSVTTPHASDSPPRWGRSWRSRWGSVSCQALAACSGECVQEDNCQVSNLPVRFLESS
jgi:hypothetical protein